MASILHYLVPGTSNFFVFQKGSRRVEEKGQQSANFATTQGRLGWSERARLFFWQQPHGLTHLEKLRLLNALQFVLVELQFFVQPQSPGRSFIELSLQFG